MHLELPFTVCAVDGRKKKGEKMEEEESGNIPMTK
jgi:hypothetical protein